MPSGPSIVIISGSPGSGKSTVAAALAERSDRAVHLVSDEFYRWIVSGFVRPHLPESRVQNAAVMDVVVDAVCGYADAGYDVFWDGVVGPWWLDRVVARLTARGHRAQLLVLRSSRETTLDRVVARDGSLGNSGAEVMFEQFADLGDYEVNVVDAEGTPEEMVTRCAEALSTGLLRLETDGRIDERG